MEYSDPNGGTSPPDFVSDWVVVDHPNAQTGGDWMLLEGENEEVFIGDENAEEEDVDEDEDETYGDYFYEGESFCGDDDDDTPDPLSRHLSGIFYNTREGMVTFASFSGSDPLPDPNLSFLPEPVAVKASNGGLVCCRGWNTLSYYVCNPLTAAWTSIPAPHHDHGVDPAVVLVLDGDQEYYLVCAYPILDYDEFGGEVEMVYGFETFSSKVLDWVRSGCLVEGVEILPETGVAGGDVATWRTAAGTVVAYNPAMDFSTKTAAPEGLGNWELGELDGKLCCACVMGRSAMVVEGGVERWMVVGFVNAAVDEAVIEEEERGMWAPEQEWIPVRSQGGGEVLLWEWWQGRWQVAARNVVTGGVRRLTGNVPQVGDAVVPYLCSDRHFKTIPKEENMEAEDPITCNEEGQGEQVEDDKGQEVEDGSGNVEQEEDLCSNGFQVHLSSSPSKKKKID